MSLGILLSRDNESKKSSADIGFCSGLLDEKAGGFVGWSELSRKGFRDTGLCLVVGSSNGEAARDAGAASRPAGEAARLRKGLLEDRWIDSPAGGSCPLGKDPGPDIATG